MDEYAIYRNDAQLKIEAQRNQEFFNRIYDRFKNADVETREGYIAFGGGAEVKQIEPESDLPF